ncbi:hypothetical protein CPC08DRAFT_646787 [Agrocybe pediades]|nr:hypothetical protein CPC08DRAFT_646787 [Agrocybe pediades]
MAIQRSLGNYFNGKSANSKHRYRRFTRIYQCQGGIDNECGRHSSKKRQIPWKNVDCLCWIRLITVHDENNGGIMLAIDEISGIFDHSDLCMEQIEMERDPPIPIHPELRQFALEQLRKNAPLSLLRSECAAWANLRWPNEVGNNSFRFRLTAHDSSSLYRSIARERGIPQRSAAEENLDRWFCSDKPLPPSPLLTNSCLHYQPHRVPETDRFEIILSTPQMQAAAWKYGHKKQVLMDLTFGFCSARALLCILLALDGNGSGIPICFILFTARKSAKATHADYNTALLERLLRSFKEKMGTNPDGEAFCISVGNTDNDPRERTALTSNWPDISLLLCMFHIWQAWRNMLNRKLRSVPQGDERQQVRKSLGKLVMELLKDITEHTAALNRLRDEISHWEKISRKRNTSSKCQSAAALSFLEYLRSYVENEAYWLSWSPRGAIEASKRLGVPLKSVARTTNPLESFNGRIKGRYFRPYQHSGRLPRIDVWVLLLVTDVIPDFFKEREEKAALGKFYANKRRLPGMDSEAVTLVRRTVTVALNILCQRQVKLHSVKGFDTASSECNHKQ